MIRFTPFRAAFAALAFALVSGGAPTPGSAAETSPSEAPAETVDFFADNGFGNAVGPVGGVHHEGVTYVSYQGPLEDAWIASYCHESDTWEGPFLAGVSLMGKDPTRDKIDNHGKPAMVIDDEGYIHLAYGGHGGTRETGRNPLGNLHYGEQRNVVSKRPLDITAWEQLDNVSPFGTYSNFLKMDNGDIYLLYRHGAHRSDWVYQLSTDNGRTFGAPVSFLKTKRHSEVAGMDSWYATFRKVDGDRIGVRFFYHLCKDLPHHDGDRRHGYFMELSTRDGTWRNVRGESLTVPVTKEHADENAKIVDTGDDIVHGGPLSFDSEGNPHILLYRTQDKSTIHGGPKTIYHYRWTGEKWVERRQPGLPRLTGHMDAHTPEKISLVLAGRTEDRVAEVAEWHSHDGGETFEKGRVHFTRPGVGVQMSQPIANAHPDARFVLSVVQPRSDYRFMMLAGDSGPVQRPRAEAEVLTEEQLNAPLFGKAR